MNVEEQVASLKARHAELEEALSQENARPLPDAATTCGSQETQTQDQGRTRQADGSNRLDPPRPLSLRTTGRFLPVQVFVAAIPTEEEAS